MARFTQFVGQLFWFIIIMVAIACVVFTVQTIWHPFNALIAFINQDVDKVNSTLTGEVVGGISFAALLLFLVLLLIPLLIRGVNNKQFITGFLRGILASAVYLVTDYFYSSMEKLGRFWLVLAILFSIVVTFVLVELITRAGKKKDEVSVRTDLTSSISSGLAFGLIIKLVTYGLANLQTWKF